MNRNGVLAILDEKGREKERYTDRVRRQAEGRTKATTVKVGATLVEWDPYTFAILTEVSGTIQFKDLIEGVTMHEELDEVTGLSRWVVTDSPDEKRQPTIQIRDDKHKVLRKYLIPSRAHLMVADGDEVHQGDVLAKIPRETTKTKDITGGLPRVVELFEARKPRETAVITEIDGIVKYGDIAKGQRKIHGHQRKRCRARILAAARRSRERPGRRTCACRRTVDGWPAQPARHSGGSR